MSSWFDKQIRLRKKRDDENFSHTLMKIADAVTGDNTALDLTGTEGRTQGAIEDILRYYHVASRDIPDKLKTLEERLDFALHTSGIYKREVELTEGWQKDAFGAMIGFIVDNESGVRIPVALLPSGLTGYKFYDVDAGGLCSRHCA